MTHLTPRAWSLKLAAIIAGLLLTVHPSDGDETDDPAGIIYSHKYHAAMAIECDVCHAAADTSGAGSDDLLPAKPVCAECHDVEDPDNCGECHAEGTSPAALVRITDYSPKFDHAVHAEQGIGCDRCHPDVADSDSSATHHLPPMPPCMVCHDGETADKSCIVCHEDPDGKLPEDHQPKEWIADHVFAFSLDMGESCKVCHNNEQCQRCHLDRVLLKP